MVFGLIQKRVFTIFDVAVDFAFIKEFSQGFENGFRWFFDLIGDFNET